MTSYQLKAAKALEAYRKGQKVLAHYMWEEAKVELMRRVCK